MDMEIVEKLQERFGVRLSEESAQLFASVLERKQYRKDESILGQGEVSRYMYIIETGLIRQFYYKDGRDITEHFSCEGDIAACLESLFLQKPTELLVEALEPSVIYLLDYEAWEKLCDAHPDINEIYRRMIESKLIVSQRKADSWRFESAHERYDRFLRDYPGVAKRASVAHIASYLLMTPETLSRVRAGTL